MSKNKTRKPKTPVLLQLYARAKAPCRDYYGLTVSEINATLNIWKITHGPHLFPKEKQCPLEDVPYDKYFQEEIKNVFGASVCQYLIDLGNKQRRLENMPNKIFLHILIYLGPSDILQLSQTSKLFRELCNTELVWCMMFKKTLKRNPSPDEKRMAFDCGFKEVLKMRTLLLRKTSQNKLKPKESATQVKKSVTSVSDKSTRLPGLVPDKKKSTPAIKPRRNLMKAK